MTDPLEPRVSRIETAAGGDGVCPECDRYPDGSHPEGVDVDVRIEWPTEMGGDDDSEPGPCPVCGLEPIVIEWPPGL